MIQVGLLSPALAVRVGLRALLEADTQIMVVVEGESLADLRAHSPLVDVLVVTGESLALQDMKLSSFDDWPEAAVLLLGRDAEGMHLFTQFGVRAWGMLPQEATQEELLAAVHALYEGLIVGEPSMLLSLMGPPDQIVERVLDEPVEMLTERELEVLQLVAHGLANKQIAAHLGISAHTVKFHISSIYGKLSAANRTEAVRIGLQMGLILL